MTTALLGRTATHLRVDHDIDPEPDDSLSRRARKRAEQGPSRTRTRRHRFRCDRHGKAAVTHPEPPIAGDRPPPCWAPSSACAQSWSGSAGDWTRPGCGRRSPPRRSPWAGCSSIWPSSRTTTFTRRLLGRELGAAVGHGGLGRRPRLGMAHGRRGHPRAAHDALAATPWPAHAPRSTRRWPTAAWISWPRASATPDGRGTQPAADPDRPDRGVRAARRATPTSSGSPSTASWGRIRRTTG